MSFIDPVCGFLVEAVSGRSVEVLTSARDRLEYNYGNKNFYKRDANKLQDTSGNREADGSNTVYPGPPDIIKIGHVVLSTSRLEITQIDEIYD